MHWSSLVFANLVPLVPFPVAALRISCSDLRLFRCDATSRMESRCCWGGLTLSAHVTPCRATPRQGKLVLRPGSGCRLRGYHARSRAWKHFLPINLAGPASSTSSSWAQALCQCLEHRLADLQRSPALFRIANGALLVHASAGSAAAGAGSRAPFNHAMPPGWRRDHVLSAG